VHLQVPTADEAIAIYFRKEDRYMKTFQIELPPEISENEAQLLLAIKLYELGRVSLGQAAKVAGYSKLAFIEVLGKYGVPVVAYAPEELREEVEE
jgi:predicted HTH domain antitoxin